jgi:hypothetical protein
MAQKDFFCAIFIFEWACLGLDTLIVAETKTGDGHRAVIEVQAFRADHMQAWLESRDLDISAVTAQLF